MARNGPEGPPAMLVGSGVRRQIAVNYSGGDVPLSRTSGLACNVGGTVSFIDGAGNAASRLMMAGVDYPWEVTQITSAGTTAGMGIYALYSQ